jgi:hypothetical protein
MVDRMPSATEFRRSISKSIAFFVALWVSVDNIGFFSMSLDLDDINGVAPQVMRVPNSSPYVSVVLESTYSSSAPSFERIHHPSTIGEENHPWFVLQVTYVLE